MTQKENHTDYNNIILDEELKQAIGILMHIKNFKHTLVAKAVHKAQKSSLLKWVGLVGLALSFFLYAQGQATTKGEQATKVDTNTAMIKQLVLADEKAVEFRVVQTAQMATQIEKTDNIEDDVEEIKQDNKEMIRLLIEINNK